MSPDALTVTCATAPKFTVEFGDVSITVPLDAGEVIALSTLSETVKRLAHAAYLLQLDRINAARYGDRVHEIPTKKVMDAFTNAASYGRRFSPSIAPVVKKRK